MGKAVCYELQAISYKYNISVYFLSLYGNPSILNQHLRI